jgi:hypothetical protein
MRKASLLNYVAIFSFVLLFSSIYASEKEPNEINSSESRGPTEPIFDGHEVELFAKAYQWGWPLVYLHNVKNSLSLISTPGVSGGAPVAPVNRLSMLTEPLDPKFKSVPCPNRDVIYGFALLDLEKDAVVIQVPEAKSNIWMFQLGDHRTDSFGALGSIYGSKPGLYLVVGPNWIGEKPEGFVDVFRSTTNLAYVIPRYFVNAGNLTEVQTIIKEIATYPFENFSGRWKVQNWNKKKWYPSVGETTRERCKQVNPGSFFTSLRNVLEQVPPLDGEESFYKDLTQALDRVLNDETKRNELIHLAEGFEKELITPHFDFRNVGTSLPHGWTTVTNAASYGTDYMSRMAVAKSNIFVNRPREAKYFYLEVDKYGERLNGNQKYEIVLNPDQLPKNQGFWSLTVYDEHHHLVENDKQCSSFAIATQESLEDHSEGIRVMLCSERPEREGVRWIPIPKGVFTLYLRVYSPSESVAQGEWSPPGVSPIHNVFFVAK